MVKVVQKALTEGRWEIGMARKKEEREKTSPALTKDPVHRGQQWIPPTFWKCHLVTDSEGKWDFTRREGEARTTQIKSERRRATQTGSFGIPLPVHSKRIPNAYFFHVRICLALISKAHSACQDNFHSSPGHPAIERFHSRKRKHTLRPM